MFSVPQPVKALPRFLGEDGVVARAATAPTLPLRGPEVVLVGDARVNGRRQLTVRVRSRRGAPWLHLFVESGKVLSATIDDAPFETRPGGDDVADGAPWAFRFIGVDEEGFVLKIVVDPAAGPYGSRPSTSPPASTTPSDASHPTR